MGKQLDLTGQRFGKLTVLSKAEDYIQPCGQTRTAWLCKCDCGNTKIVTTNCLRGNHTKSCGCSKHERSKLFNDLTGQRFGMLTVIEHKGKMYYDSGAQRHLWLCKCDCGNYKVVNGEDLKSARVKSCGCIIKTNTYEHDDKYTYIKIHKNNVTTTAIIDKEFFEKVKDISWAVTAKGYIRGRYKRKGVMLHRFILDVQDDPSIMVDHMNGNPLDNRICNLRICSAKENCRNRKTKKTRFKTKYNYPGVTFCGWRATIRVDEKNKLIGTFETEEEAIQARIEAENKYHGEFGYYNSRIKNKEESA